MSFIWNGNCTRKEQSLEQHVRLYERVDNTQFRDGRKHGLIFRKGTSQERWKNSIDAWERWISSNLFQRANDYKKRKEGTTDGKFLRKWKEGNEISRQGLDYLVKLSNFKKIYPIKRYIFTIDFMSGNKYKCPGKIDEIFESRLRLFVYYRSYVFYFTLRASRTRYSELAIYYHSRWNVSRAGQLFFPVPADNPGGFERKTWPSVSRIFKTW